MDVRCWSRRMLPRSLRNRRAAIEKAIQSYVAAFNTRDAKKLAAHWSPEAVYTSRVTGSEITGREDLEKEFAAQLDAMPSAQLHAQTDFIEFISPNVALETGNAIVTQPDTEPNESSYRAVLSSATENG